jgi:hypothetical protein
VAGSLVAPPGWRAVAVGPGPGPVLDRLAATASVTPTESSVLAFTRENEPRAAITVTRATYTGAREAMTAYNAWFAEYGFIAAAERSALDVGDQAVRYEVGWPHLHAVVARSGARLVLVDAAPAVPPARAADVMERLARAAVAAAP